MTQAFSSAFKSCVVCNFGEGRRTLNAFKDPFVVDFGFVITFYGV